MDSLGRKGREAEWTSWSTRPLETHAYESKIKAIKAYEGPPNADEVLRDALRAHNANMSFHISNSFTAPSSARSLARVQYEDFVLDTHISAEAAGRIGGSFTNGTSNSRMTAIGRNANSTRSSLPESSGSSEEDASYPPLADLPFVEDNSTPASGLTTSSSATRRTAFAAPAAPGSSTHDHTLAPGVPRAATPPRTAPVALSGGLFGPRAPQEPRPRLGNSSSSSNPRPGMATGPAQGPMGCGPEQMAAAAPPGNPGAGTRRPHNRISRLSLAEYTSGSAPGARAERPGTAADSGGSSLSGAHMQVPVAAIAAQKACGQEGQEQGGDGEGSEADSPFVAPTPGYASPHKARGPSSGSGTGAADGYVVLSSRAPLSPRAPPSPRTSSGDPPTTSPAHSDTIPAAAAYTGAAAHTPHRLPARRCSALTATPPTTLATASSSPSPIAQPPTTAIEAHPRASRMRHLPGRFASSSGPTSFTPGGPNGPSALTEVPRIISSPSTSLFDPELTSALHRLISSSDDKESDRAGGSGAANPLLGHLARAGGGAAGPVGATSPAGAAAGAGSRGGTPLARLSRQVPLDASSPRGTTNGMAGGSGRLSTGQHEQLLQQLAALQRQPQAGSNSDCDAAAAAVAGRGESFSALRQRRQQQSITCALRPTGSAGTGTAAGASSVPISPAAAAAPTGPWTRSAAAGSASSPVHPQQQQPGARAASPASRSAAKGSQSSLGSAALNLLRRISRSPARHQPTQEHDWNSPTSPISPGFQNAGLQPRSTSALFARPAVQAWDGSPGGGTAATAAIDSPAKRTSGDWGSSSHRALMPAAATTSTPQAPALSLIFAPGVQRSAASTPASSAPSPVSAAPAPVASPRPPSARLQPIRGYPGSSAALSPVSPSTAAHSPSQQPGGSSSLPGEMQHAQQQQQPQSGKSEAAASPRSSLDMPPLPRMSRLGSSGSSSGQHPLVRGPGGLLAKLGSIGERNRRGSTGAVPDELLESLSIWAGNGASGGRV